MSVKFRPMNGPLVGFVAAVIGGAAGWHCGLPGRLAVDLRSDAERAVITGLNATSEAAKYSEKIILNAEQIRSRLEEIMASPVRDSQELQRLMARWVVTDLEGAKAWIRAFPDEKSETYAPSSQPVKDFFKAWAEIDPVSAMAEAVAVRGGKSFTARNGVILGLARADFKTIGDILTTASEGKYDPRKAVEGLMRQLIARDRPAAMALALSLKGLAGEGAVGGIASVWARTDPEGALTWAGQHPEASTRDNAAKTILTEWARHDPQSVGPMLLQKRDGSPDLFHTAAAAEAVARLSEASPEAAAGFVEKFYPKDHLKANFSSLFVRLMVQEAGNPQSAAAICACVNVLSEEELKSSKLWNGSWVSDLAPSWGRMWAEPQSPGRDFLIGEIGRKFSKESPVQTINDIMTKADPSTREELLRAVFSEDGGFKNLSGTDGITQFRQAVETMPESVRVHGAVHLAWSLAARDPMGAAEVIRQFPAAADSNNLIENMAIRMAGRVDLGAAQVWADSLPTPATQSRGYGGIVSGHYPKDSEATSRWVQTLPPSPGRDGAAQVLANRASEDDPVAAFAWADSIGNVNQREESTKTVLRSWVAVDQAAAMAALEQSNLADEKKNALINTLFESK